MGLRNFYLVSILNLKVAIKPADIYEAIKISFFIKKSEGLTTFPSAGRFKFAGTLRSLANVTLQTAKNKQLSVLIIRVGIRYVIYPVGEIKVTSGSYLEKVRGA